MTITLTPLELFYGSLTFIAVVISIILGIIIAFKYRKYKKVEFLLVGVTWIFIVTPYSGDALQFIYYLIFQEQIGTNLYFFIATTFIAPIHVTWIVALTKFILRKHKKTLISIFSIEAMFFEVAFLIVFFFYPDLVGERKSAFVVEWAFWIQIYLLASIALFLITGFMFARQSLKSKAPELKVKGSFLLTAVLCFTIGTVIDVVGAESPNEITIFLARIFLIASAICFYVGFIMPRFIKELFVKETV